MLVAYARTSTVDQAAGLDAQIAELCKSGCEKLFKEQVSSAGTRSQLHAALEFCREADSLVVTKLDRLARSVTHLGEIVARLEAKNVGLRVLDLNLDSTTPTGRLMLNVLVSVARFEREILLERQREGIARAKNDGKYKGRKPTARAKTDQVKKLIAAGVKPVEIVKQLSISRASVYRCAKLPAPANRRHIRIHG